VTQVFKKIAVAVIKEKRKLKPLVKPYIVLCVCVPRFGKFDEIVEKAVELGVWEVKPVLSEHSFVREARKISDNKWQRWQKIIRAATAQSARAGLMRLSKPEKLKDLVERVNHTDSIGGFFAYEGFSEACFREAILTLKAQKLDQVYLFVGSEGGFSLGEVELFCQNGLSPVSFGDQVLRVETACLAFISILKYEML